MVAALLVVDAAVFAAGAARPEVYRGELRSWSSTLPSLLRGPRPELRSWSSTPRNELRSSRQRMSLHSFRDGRGRLGQRRSNLLHARRNTCKVSAHAGHPLHALPFRVLGGTVYVYGSTWSLSHVCTLLRLGSLRQRGRSCIGCTKRRRCLWQAPFAAALSEDRDDEAS